MSRDSYRVDILEEGRSGALEYSEGFGKKLSFYWEFGGGDTVVSINVPTRAEWGAAAPWAADRRDEVLERVAAEACRLRCPKCRPRIGDAWIELLVPIADA